MTKYLINDYIKDIDKKGLKKTWHTILSKTMAKEFDTELFNIDNYGELYEIGLEHDTAVLTEKKNMLIIRF